MFFKGWEHSGLPHFFDQKLHKQTILYNTKVSLIKTIAKEVQTCNTQYNKDTYIKVSSNIVMEREFDRYIVELSKIFLQPYDYYS